MIYFAILLDLKKGRRTEMSEKKFSQELRFAIEVATRAGEVISGFYDKRLDQSWTSRSHFKTAADDASEAIIREMIRVRYPGHNIWSEEGGRSDNNSAFTWVWDAIDGTIPMFFGISDHFCVCGALCKGTKPILGVANAVKRKEMYVGEIGVGAYCNGKPIRVSDETEISHVVIGIDSGKYSRDAHIPFLQKACGPGGTVTHLSGGCASVPLLLVASGVLHAYLATSLEQEDMAAATLIIREAGGRVTNLTGEEWKLGDQSILAANPILHKRFGKFFEIF